MTYVHVMDETEEDIMEGLANVPEKKRLVEIFDFKMYTNVYPRKSIAKPDTYKKYAQTHSELPDNWIKELKDLNTLISKMYTGLNAKKKRSFNLLVREREKLLQAIEVSKPKRTPVCPYCSPTICCFTVS